MRQEVQELSRLGSMPSEFEIKDEQLAIYGRLITAIIPPVTDEEARELVRILGPDGGHGAMFTLLHLIETAPGWPIVDALTGDAEGIQILRSRAINAGHDLEK
jgi:hypothetical protein